MNDLSSSCIDGRVVAVRFRYVLVEYDNSTRTRVAVQRAADIAFEHGARLHVLWVVDMPTVGLDVALSVFEDEVCYATGQLESLRHDLGDRLAHTQIAVRVGERVREVVRYAREYSVGEVVVAVERRIPKFMSAGARIKRMLADEGCKVTVVDVGDRN
ncbi:universal stress protein [Paraburkholderia sp. C35]|uniref:universal stress protein n=1 Tax=Paraburkholderia sp. C35 TaxID=2126993 RepID=UPI0013A543E7|nr:universal stress protein [Paraburkholderia sp. C35]